MKRILSYLSIALLSASVACSDDGGTDKVCNSVITPGFTFGEEEIIAGVTPVAFANTTTAEGTTVSEYFWHFGFAGEGNWSEEAVPDPIVYDRPGDYTVTLTAWGADGNRASTTRTLTILADNLLPAADFSYMPQMVSVGTTVTFTDRSADSDGSIASREWLFPDGTTSTEINATYTFQQAGMFNVRLTVTDDRGGTSTASKTINVRSGDVGAFTLLWSTAVASADALCTASVVAASDMGYIYAVSGDGKMVALNTDGAKVWEYDAMAKDGVYLKSEISYPSVDTDGTVYWVGHGYGGSSSASVAYAFDGATGSVLWKNTTAYAPAARIAFSTPCISPSMVIVGSRGTNGAIRGFEKSTGKNTATATPANGGGTSGTIALKSGVVIFTNTAEYGYGIMVPDASFVWSPVPTSDTFAPGKILSAGRCQPCVDANNCVYLAGSVYGSGTWNLASFDCTNLTASSKKTPKWSVNLPGGFSQTGASLSADGSTLYIVADKADPSVVYALNTANGSTRWSYTLDAASNSIPAVDNLGQIHLCTKTGDYVVLSAEGELRYKEHLADSVNGSPTISEWGYSYFLGKDSAAGALKVYCVALPGVASPAASAWSQYGQNARHSNCQK